MSSPTGTESNRKPQTGPGILIVEDQAIAALHIRRHLEKLGYRVSGVATSGEDALSLLEQDRPDLVLMDILLDGEMCGTQAAKVIEQRFEVPVVYLTAYSDPATVQKVEEAGGHGFLTKPFREQDLHPVIRLALTRHDRQKREREQERETWADLCRKSHEQLETFTYAAGHDLKEPLRTTRSFLDLLALRTSGKLDEKERELIIRAQDGLQRMNTLLGDLLQYAQAGLSPGAPIPETPSGSALNWALENLRSAIGEAGAEVIYEELPVVQADPSQLAQVFQNLLGNSIKYRSPDRPLRIDVTAESRESQWIFCVRDNGIGFEQHQAGQIFAPFKRLHNRNDYPGTGVGLAICRKIVEAHGGQIRAESKPGEGSTFCFTLPQRS